MKNIPESFHMYFSFEGAKSFLESLQLKMSFATEFNDPFELSPQIPNLKKILKKGIKTTLPVSTTDYVNVISSSAAMLGAAGVIAGVPALLLFSPLPVIGLTGLLIRLLYKFFTGKEKEDEIDPVFVYERSKILLSNFKMACFSEDDKNILMWSHYARKHSGVVITFNNVYNIFEDNITRVTYSDDKLDINSDKTDEPELILKRIERDLLTQKATCWSYEKELRFIRPVNACMTAGKESYIQLDANCIKAVTLGCRMENANKDAIIALVNNKLPNCKLRSSFPSGTKYELEIEDIT